MNKRTLKNDFIEIEYLTHSLRISGLKPAGGTNLFVDLQGETPIPTPYGDFFFRGGHRLWHAPESMPRTYAPDTGPLQITETTNGVILETNTEPGTGIRKRIEIRLAQDQPAATLIHTLINDGPWAATLAPWTITQLRPGGIAILPQPLGAADPAGLLPNRHFSLWPYSRINDPRLRLHDHVILFDARSLPPFKIGYFSEQGWLAYYVDGVLFKKSFTVTRSTSHPDNNSNAELYACETFLELESLSPLASLEPGAEVTHLETWQIYSGIQSLPDDIQTLLR